MTPTPRTVVASEPGLLSIAGLGAGWDQAEIEAIGLTFPSDVGERAGRYIEAGRVVRALFDVRTVAFTGRWYELQVPAIGPDVVSPSLVVSVGGKRTTAALAPIADIVEVKLPGFATTGKGPSTCAACARSGWPSVLSG